MSNKKDICPVCNENEKGIKSKTCKPCFIAANLGVKHPVKPVAVDISSSDEEYSSESLIGQTTKNGMFYK